jgi:glutathione S-transferase
MVYSLIRNERNHSRTQGPHPWKVVILLKELGMAYDIEFLTADEMKVPPYIDICPNGRAPTIFDPNTGITLWEVVETS